MEMVRINNSGKFPALSSGSRSYLVIKHGRKIVRILDWTTLEFFNLDEREFVLSAALMKSFNRIFVSKCMRQGLRTREQRKKQVQAVLKSLKEGK